MHDYSLASERVKLGRSVYSACATLTENSKNRSSSPLNATAKKSSNSGDLASAGVASTLYRNSASQTVHNILDFCAQLRGRSGSSGWNNSVASGSPLSPVLLRELSTFSSEGGEGCDSTNNSSAAQWSSSLLESEKGAANMGDPYINTLTR